MRFAHLADCHIGSWREPRLRDVTTKAFCRAIDEALKRGVDFILISGDLFNTSLPSLDLLKIVVKKLHEVKQKGVPVYGIAGSHDYSPSGKTMLDVLAEAGLYIDVAKFEEAGDKIRLHLTRDERTGAKITGIIGKKGGLEKDYYHYIDREPLEAEPGYKIFLFHTALEELKPEHLAKMEANPISLLPRGFDYYAGGHVHIVRHKDLEGYKNVVYPGPLFPNSFSELEKLDGGGFYLVDREKDSVDFVPIIIHPIVNLELEAEYASPEMITKELLQKTDRRFDDAVVTIRLSGHLREGALADIDFRAVFDRCYQGGAHFVMKNTSRLRTTDLEEVQVRRENVEQIERSVIAEHVGQFEEFEPDEQKRLATSLLQALSQEKGDGERVIDFEEKVVGDVDALIEKVE